MKSTKYQPNHLIARRCLKTEKLLIPLHKYRVSSFFLKITMKMKYILDDRTNIQPSILKPPSFLDSLRKVTYLGICHTVFLEMISRLYPRFYPHAKVLLIL